MITIQLLFDKVSNTNITKYMNLVKDVSKNDFIIKNEIQPHMTIASLGTEDVMEVKRRFISLEGRPGLRGGTLNMDSILVLTNGKIGGNVACSSYLSDMAKLLFEEFGRIPKTTRDPKYTRNNFEPHVAFGKRLTNEEIKKVFPVLWDEFEPVHLNVNKIVMYDTDRHEIIAGLPV